MESSPNTSNGRRFNEQLARNLLPLLNAPELTTSGVHAMSEALLTDAMRERASDVHLEPETGGVRLRLRIDGVLHDVLLLTKTQARRMIRHFMTMAELDPVALFMPEESRRTIPVGDGQVDVRLTFAPTVTGDKMNIRLLDQARVETRLDVLGMSEEQLHAVQEWLRNASGILLATGPTGSGKTTTLYSILNELKEQQRAIVTIEDPVEFQIDGLTQMQVDPDHGLTFAKGIKAMLRLDPDYIMVGEIRDSESARAAIEAAASGRVVLSTLHSRDAVGAITSLRSWGLNDHEISSTVQMIIAQRLVRTLNPDGKREAAPSEDEIRWLQAVGADIPDRIYHPGATADGLGYRGRTGIFEVWDLREPDYDQIIAHADERAIRKRLHREHDHDSLLDDGLGKVRKGVTTIEELKAKLGIELRYEGDEDNEAPTGVVGDVDAVSEPDDEPSIQVA